jgi:hypothetical protein
MLRNDPTGYITSIPCNKAQKLKNANTASLGSQRCCLTKIIDNLRGKIGGLVADSLIGYIEIDASQT